jgi:hypothetical protein
MQVAARAYDEIVDLFARRTPPEEIVRFRPSRRAQNRARDLLARNKTGDLTPDEADELDRLGDLEHFMQLVKARARFYLEHRS